MSVSWPQVLPAVVLAVAVLLGPGALLLRASGASWLAAVLAAPAASVPVVIVAGLLVRLTGAPWTALTGLVAVLSVEGLGLLVVGRFVAPRVARQGRRRHTEERSQPSDASALRAVLFVGSSSLAAVYLVLAGAATSPLAIPQMPDVVFHLGAVEWMVRHGSASALDVFQYAQLDGPLAYPGAFHAVTAAVAAWTGLPVTATWHALLIVVVGLVWPFGVMLLARVVLGRGNGVLVAAGLLTLVFSAFPVAFLAWGPLWSNLLANALLPAVVAAALCALAPAAFVADRAFGAGRLRAGGYAALGLLVLLGTQPNAVASGAVIGSVVFAGALPHWRAALDRRWASVFVRLPWFLLLLFAVVFLSTRFIPSKMFLVNAHVLVTWQVAVADAVTVFAGRGVEFGLVLALVLGGVVVLARDAARRWVVVSLAAFIALFLAMYAVNGPVVRQLTWLWWNDHYRLEAAIVLPALLCAIAGAMAGGALLTRRMPDPARSRQMLGAMVAVAVVVALRGGIPAHRTVVGATYGETSPDASWVTPAEFAALQRLSDFVPAGSVVAANPYRGGMFFYVAGGVEVLYPTENSLMLPDRRLLGTSIHLVEVNPAVCAAAHRQRVDYVLNGGEMHIWGVLDHAAEYAGLDATALSSRFEPVTQVGPFALQRVPPCSPGPEGQEVVGPTSP